MCNTPVEEREKKKYRTITLYWNIYRELKKRKRFYRFVRPVPFVVHRHQLLFERLQKSPAHKHIAGSTRAKRHAYAGLTKYSSVNDKTSIRNYFFWNFFFFYAFKALLPFSDHTYRPQERRKWRALIDL